MHIFRHDWIIGNQFVDYDKVILQKYMSIDALIFVKFHQSGNQFLGVLKVINVNYFNWIKMNDVKILHFPDFFINACNCIFCRKRVSSFV